MNRDGGNEFRLRQDSLRERLYAGLPATLAHKLPRSGRAYRVRPSGRRRYTSSDSERSDGGIAQLGEHLLCKQGVSGSNPLISTKE